ncbi:hypothetical protein, partial [Neisseria bergeri]|uniref:hypothetical protein n=1 Tax=Neisseria bergeri TaxID=1906581 RepID=UPI003F737702
PSNRCRLKMAGYGGGVGIGGIGGLKPTLRNTLRRTQINTETYAPSFPRRRESKPFGTETYRIKRFL